MSVVRGYLVAQFDHTPLCNDSQIKTCANVHLGTDELKRRSKFAHRKSSIQQMYNLFFITYYLLSSELSCAQLSLYTDELIDTYNVKPRK